MLRWGRGLRGCRTLFAEQTRASDWYKICRALQGYSLVVIHQANGPKMDRIRKDIIALFKPEGLSITIDTDLIETDFLDVLFNLQMDSFFPYRKPNNTPLHIHSESNHLPSIIKQLPLKTNKRIANCRKRIATFFISSFVDFNRPLLSEIILVRVLRTRI